MFDLLTRIGRFGVMTAIVFIVAMAGVAQKSTSRRTVKTTSPKAAAVAPATPSACPAKQLGAGTARFRAREAVDYDCDGKADLSIFRPADNTWWINRSGGGFSGTNFGIASQDY